MGQSEVLITADVPLELGGGDFETGLGVHGLHRLHEMGAGGRDYRCGSEMGLERRAEGTYYLPMDDNPAFASVPAGWLEVLAESEAELAAGLTVDGDQIVRDLYAAADRLEAAHMGDQGRKAARRR